MLRNLGKELAQRQERLTFLFADINPKKMFLHQWQGCLGLSWKERCLLLLLSVCNQLLLRKDDKANDLELKCLLRPLQVHLNHLRSCVLEAVCLLCGCV